ncbi:MAG TPA: hypothetical protein VN658_02330 [Candidatus Acidoferrales bacterium]|nr:hypothetical protein [Candidatus Acidoferrales bacterium]
MDWVRKKLFEVVTLLLAIAAIVFAWIQYHDARAQLDRLQAITSSIQTQYVGEFPVNLDKVIEVVSHSSDGGELDVMTDFPGYALYSRNFKYQAYFNALVGTHQQKSVKINMLVYSRDLMERTFRIEFKPRDFEEERKNGFRDFFKNHPPGPRNYNDFVERILDLQNDAANDFCRNGIEVRRVPASQKYLFFLWQTNTPEAVFAFRNEEQRNREISFHSLDPKLIEIFKTIFDKTWADADPKQHPELAAVEDPACGYFNTRPNTADPAARK